MICKGQAFDRNLGSDDYVVGKRWRRGGAALDVSDAAPAAAPAAEAPSGPQFVSISESGAAPFDALVLPIAQCFNPELLIVSAGFDAAAGHLEAGDVQLVYGLSFDAETDGMAGATAVTLYALSINEYMAKYGVAPAQFARVSVKNHGNAVGNPWAHKPMRITVEDVLTSPMISSPYRKLDCSLTSDGAAAVILSHPDVTPNAERPRSRIAGSGLSLIHI